MTFRRAIFFWFVAALLTCLPSSLPAQSTFATLTGTVSDPSGAVMPSVTITVTSVVTNISTSTKSNEAGIYTVPGLKEGTYKIEAQIAGFKDLIVEGVKLEARDYRRLDLTLQLGELANTVEVTGGATLIETETARISDTKQAEQINSLPSSFWRGMWPLLALTPGVTPGADGSMRFAGSTANQSHWAIDGTTASDSTSTANGPMYNYVESFQEMKVDLANNSAEFGTLGQVTVISKSGGNKLHGSAFDYYLTPFFRARNPFAEKRDPGVQHFPGFSVGGPVFLPKIYNGKEKTFFFTSFETSRGTAAVDFFDPTVPLAAWREGDFSGLGTTIKDPVTGQPFPGNRIPADRISSVSQKLQDRFYPLPNVGDPNVFAFQNYRLQISRPWDPSSYFTVRGDHHFSPNNSVFARFTLTHAPIRWYNGALPAVGPNDGKRDTRQVAFSYTHTFSPTLVNEFRYGLAYNDLPYHGAINGKQLVEDLGLVGLAPDLPDISGVFKLSFFGSGITGINQWVDYTDPGYRQFGQDFQEHLSWFRGLHSLKFGATVSRYTWSDYSAPANLFGNAGFSDSFTGFDYADFLLGIPTTVDRAFSPKKVDRRRMQYAFYATDDFKVTPKLSLSLGLRYEYHPYWTEKNGLGAMFDINSGKIVVPDGSLSQVSPLFPRSYVDIVEASSLGFPGKTILRSDRNNFAPRVGIAYRPWGNNTVFRTGFGIFHDVMPYMMNLGGLPYVLNEPTYTNPIDNPTVVFPRVFPATGVGGYNTMSLPGAANPNLGIPYSMQYNFTMEHSRWGTGFRLSYVGTATRHAHWWYDVNAPVADGRPYVEKPRPFPNYPGINYTTDGAGHQYHGFTAQAERQMLKGLYFQASWTFSRDIGDMILTWDQYQNPHDRRADRGVSQEYPTHRFNFNGIYQFPFGKGRKFLGQSSRAVDLILGGWEVSTIVTAATGPFITPRYYGPDPTGTVYTDSTTPAYPWWFRPDQVGNPNLSDAERTMTRWFDINAFAAPPSGRFGNAARGSIKGLGTGIAHLTLAKTIHFSHEGGPRLRLELLANNAFNHPNYVGNTFPYVNPGFGGDHITSTGESNWHDQASMPRIFRAGVRFEW